MMVASLPESSVDCLPRAGEIWEETDGAAYIRVTRYLLREPGGDQAAVSLVVCGEDAERQRVVDEFTEVLGTPVFIERTEGFDSAWWLA